MKTRYRAWIWLTIAVSLLSLGACRPIEYYLTKVYKLHGRVTIADTVPPTPLGSVEVTVGDHHYSELTNYYGDYEMEMAEGTWTINITKEGFEPVTAEVTVGPGNPRVRLDVKMAWIEPPAPLDLTGWWDVYFEEDDEIIGPDVPFYIHQEGTAVQCSHGLVGTIDGPVFSVESLQPDDRVLLTGTASSNLIEGSLIMMEEEDEFVVGIRLVRPTITPPGHLDIKDNVFGRLLSLDTEHAVGEGGQPETFHRHSLEIGSWISGIEINTLTMTPWTTYWVTDDDPDEDQANVGVFTSDGEFLQAIGGRVEVEVYDGTGMTGALHLEFDDGRVLDVTSLDMIFDTSNGSVILNGLWPGETFPQEFASVGSTTQSSTETPFDVVYVDHQFDLRMMFTIPGVPQRGVTYTISLNDTEIPSDLPPDVPEDNAQVTVRWQIPIPDDLEDHREVTSGSFTIREYSEERISGTFAFDPPAGPAGSFDVPLIQAMF